MPPLVPAGQPPAGAPPAGGSGLPAFLRGRNGAVIAAGGTVVLVALLGLAKGGKAKDTSADTIQPAGPYDSGPYDQWAAWEEQYDDLQGRVSTLENPPTPTPTPKPPVPVPVPKPIHLPAPVGSHPVPRPPVPARPPVKLKPPPKASRSSPAVAVRPVLRGWASAKATG